MKKTALLIALGIAGLSFAAEPKKDELVGPPKTVEPVDYKVTRPIGLKAAESAEKLGWRIGSQAYTLRDRTLLEALDALHGLGIKYVEGFPGQAVSPELKNIKFQPGLPPEADAAVKKKLEDTGIKMLSFGVTGIPKDDAGARKLFEFAKSYGMERIVTEAPAAQFPQIEKLANEFDIDVALHNHPEPNIYGTPDKVLAALATGDFKRIGACADIGHWQRSGVQPAEGLKKLEGKVFEFHFKDLAEFNKKSAGDVPWGTGQGNVKAALEETKRQAGKIGGKSGKPTMNIEYETGQGTGLVRNMAKCVEWFGQTADELAK
jgi:sugar phosphate isomerase/epimerase